MSANRSMALRVVWGTRIDDDTPDAPTARDLMEMLGLVEPGGRELLPDDTRNFAEAHSGLPMDGDRDDVAVSRAKPLTTPDGLRDLPPPTRQPRRPAPPLPHLAKELQPMTTALDDPPTDTAEPVGTYIAALRCDEMFVDLTYQRPLDKARARRMADTLDPTLIGVIDVSDRGPGHHPRYAVVNGQHRRAALVLAHPDRDRAPMVCTVHQGLTPGGEARLFHELDAATKRLTGWDRWHARRAAGEPAITEIEEIVTSHGMKIGPGQRDGMLGAVGGLESLHALGGRTLLDQVLAALHAAYGRDWAGYLAPLLTGVGLLLHHYDVDLERLDAALTKSTPQQLRAQAVAYRDLMPGQLPRLVAQVLINRMNAGRGPKLADVRDRVPAGKLRITRPGRAA